MNHDRDPELQQLFDAVHRPLEGELFTRAFVERLQREQERHARYRYLGIASALILAAFAMPWLFDAAVAVSNAIAVPVSPHAEVPQWLLALTLCVTAFAFAGIRRLIRGA
jgi:hypothetical protein